jgi:hypothetical protein
VSPLQETVEALFPETRDWTYYFSTTPTHLIIGAGPPGLRVPELPTAKRTEAPIELWIRGKEETQGMLKVIHLWQDAGKQLESLLPEELQKTIKIGESFKTSFVKEWFVIQLGAGSVKDRPRPSTSPTDVRLPAQDKSVGNESHTVNIEPLAAKENSTPETAIVWRPATNSQATLPEDRNAATNHMTIIWRPAVTPTNLTPCQESGR